MVNIDPFTFFPRWASDDPSTLLSVEIAYQLSAEEAELRYGGQGTGGSKLPLPLGEGWGEGVRATIPLLQRVLGQFQYPRVRGFGRDSKYSRSLHEGDLP